MTLRTSLLPILAALTLTAQTIPADRHTAGPAPTVGSLNIVKVTAPGAPSITSSVAEAGAYSYKVVARLADSTHTEASSAASTAAGPNVLSVTGYNTISTAAVEVGAWCDVYRTAGGATQGKIGAVWCGSSFTDTGQAGDAAPAPSTNTTGAVNVAGPLTVSAAVQAGQGQTNVIAEDTDRASGLVGGAAFGRINRLFSWDGFAAGTGNYVDGKITAATGNTNVCSANDSWCEGNLNTAGRRAYPVASQGVDDPGLGVGNKAFIVVAVEEGDITGYFPNAQYDADAAYVLATYGAGVTSVDGYIYPSGMVAPTDKTWALAPYMIVRNSASEVGITQVKILKATYDGGTGTKIWYDSATSTYPTISRVLSSYAPTLGVYGVQAGTGNHAEGINTSTAGYAAHAEGYLSRAWATYSHAQNWGTQTGGLASSAAGFYTKATAYASFVVGRFNVGGGDPYAWQGTNSVFEVGTGSSASDKRSSLAVTGSGWVAMNNIVTPGLISGFSYYVTIGSQAAGNASALEIVGRRAGTGEAVSRISFINNIYELARVGLTTDSSNVNSGELTFGTAVTGTLTNRWTIPAAGHFLPFADATYDVGSGALRVRDVNASRNLNLATTSAVAYGTRSQMLSDSDGTLWFTNFNANGFTRLQLGVRGATGAALGITVAATPMISVIAADGTEVADFAVPKIKSTSGERFVCITTTGVLVSSASACSGT